MTPRRSPWWVILVVALIVATLGITAAATLLSFLAFRSLAELVGWDPATAWLVQPVVELFVLAGAAELAMRTWERRPDRSLPEVLIYTALVVSIAVNVSSHVLANVAARALWWHTAVIGVMAAFVPLAQVGGVFLLTDRLRALGDRRAVGEVAVVREEVTDAGGSDTPVPGPSAPDDDESVDDLLLVGQAIAAELHTKGETLNRRRLIEGIRERGHQVSTTRATELLKRLRDAA